MNTWATNQQHHDLAHALLLIYGLKYYTTSHIKSKIT